MQRRKQVNINETPYSNLKIFAHANKIEEVKKGNRIAPTAKRELRIVAVHIDDEFDTEISKQNEKKICEKCGIDIRLITPDEKQYKELPRVYMRAGAPNLAIPFISVKKMKEST